MTTETQSTRVDRELAAVLITLAPLGQRGTSYVNTQRREFDYEAMLFSQAWSSGERQLVLAAGALWKGRTVEGLDLSYLATLSGSFFSAFTDGIAAYRGADFSTDWADALTDAAVDRSVSS